MLERRQLVELWRTDKSGVLVTLVRAEGSSYRRPGARILTTSSPSLYAGTVSGGCLESEVVKKAAWLTRNGASIERYSMSFDDTAEIPFGLGCGGTVDLLFEPLDSPEAHALMQAQARSLDRQQATVVSFLPGGGRSLRRLILSSTGEAIFASKGLSPDKIACARMLKPGEVYDGRFVEFLEAPQRLFILGAGDDAKPLVDTAARLGWDVIVADSRAALARSIRFPLAKQVVFLEAGSTLDVEARDAVVLMTHSYEQDRSSLAAFLPRAPRYLGLLGSRHRSSLLIAETALQLGLSIEVCCQRVFAPVGMDLGGDGPESIALAIVAEIEAVCHGRTGSSRRLSPQEIAVQIEKGGASLYLAAQCTLGAG